LKTSTDNVEKEYAIRLLWWQNVCNSCLWSYSAPLGTT